LARRPPGETQRHQPTPPLQTGKGYQIVVITYVEHTILPTEPVYLKFTLASRPCYRRSLLRVCCSLAKKERTRYSVEMLCNLISTMSLTWQSCVYKLIGLIGRTSRCLHTI
jgi:hypothetical protein